jgi:hypothetical protein
LEQGFRTIPAVEASRYRLIYLGLGLALVAVVALAVAFGSPEGGALPRPDQLEDISPRPGETVPRQAQLLVDVQSGYEVEIFVDGFLLPDSEVSFVAATGVARWQPFPGGVITEWTPGTHEVIVRWNTVAGLADRGEYTWTFRVF